MIPAEQFDAATKGIAALVETLDRLDAQRRQHCTAFADTVHSIDRLHAIGLPAERECTRLLKLHRQLDALEHRAIIVIAGLSAFLEGIRND